VLHPHNTRYGLTLDNTTAGQLKVTVTGSNDTITWSGPSGGNWDVISSANWTGPHDSLFYQGDAVKFTGETEDVEVNVFGDVSDSVLYPASIMVNSSKNYTFSGAGRLSGGTGITKSGVGTLTVANTGGNDFTGTVTITGGTLVAGSATALGSTIGETVINGGTLDLNGYYNFRQEPISVQGAGADGSIGAIVNNHTDQTSYVEPHLYYVTLTGDATIGGSHSWSIQGNVPAYSGWAPGYLDGNSTNHYALTKVGSTEITLADLGATNLGDVYVAEGTLTVSGNTDLGASALTLLGGATLKLSDATATVRKSLNVASTGGVINNASGNSTIAGPGGTLSGLLTVHTAGETTLTLGNPLSGTGGLTKDEEGTLLLSGANSYQGDTTVTAGVLEIGSTGQMTGSTILNSAVLQVDSGTHTVKAVQGTGVMNVLASANVTAERITQNTLTIAAGAKVVIAPLPAGSGAAVPVPEPGTWLFLLLGLLGIAGRRVIRIRRHT
jgi:autotransporter-associated beta strand protein